jgi:hypothetical protein
MLDFNVKTILPWVILTLLTAYVAVLSYYATHREPPEPAISFYSQGRVEVVLHGADTNDVAILGEFNNIIEGDQQMIAAQALDSNRFELLFQINSPRPARLYLNDFPHDIFLVQDSSLIVHAQYTDKQPDSLHFEGSPAGICRYYEKKTARFNRDQIGYFRNTRYTESPEQHAALLDSLARNELAFLLEQVTPCQLPDWFIAFEKNEILFQKAYLKLSYAPKEEPFPGYYDQIPVKDDGAVFSYTYNLYLRNLIERGASRALESHIAMADSILTGEGRDVFITRSLLSAWAKGEREVVQELYTRYAPSFSKKKYARFLKQQMDKNNVE